MRKTESATQFCPNCGENIVEVYDTRIVRGEHQRRRRCGADDCGHTWITVEIERAEYETLLALQASM